MANRIMIIDHDHRSMTELELKLRALDYDNLVVATSADHALAFLAEDRLVDLALIDMRMPEINGLVILDQIKNTSPGTECIMLTAINEARTAIECLKKGAYDYLVKPVTKEVLALTLPKALERKRLLDILDMEKRQSRPELINPEPFAPIITGSACMLRILKQAELHAVTNVPILITGESGTGKELLAWAIHHASPRAEHAFTPINMASISANLFEADFFKHVNSEGDGPGTPPGILEHAHKGTLFLDEIGDLPLELQGKLLRVLQEGAFSRVGSSDRVVIDLRVIAATNEDLDSMIARKAFRKDLYYRIRSSWLHLPPLRNRSGDIPLLVDAFLHKYDAYTQTGRHITDRALERLTEFSWPGNVRQLKTVLQSAVLKAQGCTVDVAHLPDNVRAATRRPKRSAPQREHQSIRALAEVEKAHILRVFRHFGHNKSQTAKALGIGLNTLRRKLAAYKPD
jgi:two-component system, NtrC family, response regulator AtoC